jgi:hypothetical protein
MDKQLRVNLTQNCNLNQKCSGDLLRSPVAGLKPRSYMFDSNSLSLRAKRGNLRLATTCKIKTVI